MRHVCTLLAFGIALYAQDAASLFEQAPPVIDNALRERVNAFYQAHAEGKFRAADAFVAEESKDVFFESDKRRCRKFSLQKITYFDDYTRATVLISCDTEMMIPPKGLMSVTMPVASQWRVENGTWMWFVVSTKQRQTPFGAMNPGADSSAPSPVAVPKGPSIQDLVNSVKFSRTVVPMNPKLASIEEVEISSQLPGELKLQLEPLGNKDVIAELGKSTLKGKDSTKLQISYKPDPARERAANTYAEVHIKAAQLNQTYVVKVQFQ
ncbi:MAG: hypothetical protein HYZ37_02540 [Candidatus Solibacter usitatus]|nr:hypothetical protein [Candidatus Solibacter usitatus]